MAPIVPGFTTHPAKLEATIKAIADHGALFMGANLLYLKDGTRDHFMGFLEREFPQLSAGYRRLYAGAYAPREYVASVRSMIDMLQRRYDIRSRRRPAPGEPQGGPEERDGDGGEAPSASPPVQGSLPMD
jgi:DNA repair photolyase